MGRLAVFTAVAAFLLVIAGGWVTSTDSGLSVPDWPLSYGRFLPPMVGGIRFEHSHRMIAAGVGGLTLILCLWLLAREPRRWVRWLGVGALGSVVLQGILGGLTVLWQLPLPVSVAHACLGQLFFTVIVLLATVLSPHWKIGTNRWPTLETDRALPRRALITTGAVYVQLILGAILRHAGWQTRWIVAHGIGALVVAALLGATSAKVARRFRENPALAGLARWLSWLLLVQMGLGIATLIRGADPVSATTHVAVGALILAGCVILTARLHQLLSVSIPFSDLFTRPYLDLTKPRLTCLAVVTGLIGFWLGLTGPADWGKLLALLAGTALVGGGAGALNQVLEREADARMDRTRNRPIPSGRIAPESALVFGVCLSAGGLLLLAFGAGRLAGSIGAATLASYLFLYTPLKSRTALCTLIGAIPGALPPLIGWAAARGSLNLEAWLLFGIVFLWQLPHFLALAWEYRADYARAGFKMLPVVDPGGDLTFRQIALYSAALVPASLLPAALGSAGTFYFFGALGASLLFLRLGLAAGRSRSAEAAHRLFLASVVYLPFLLFTLSLDKVIS